MDNLINYDDIFSNCLEICENINDDNVIEVFPKLDLCLELSENVGWEKVLFQKSLLGVVRMCRKDFLRETKLCFEDVTEIANYFSEYIKKMVHLDGISVGLQPFIDDQDNIEKRGTYVDVKFMPILFFLMVLIFCTCLLGFCTCWVCYKLDRYQEDCSLVLPKDIAANLAMTCQEMGLDPCEMKVLKEKTCFDKEYECIVNKYLNRRGESDCSIIRDRNNE